MKIKTTNEFSAENVFRVSALKSQRFLQFAIAMRRCPSQTEAASYFGDKTILSFSKKGKTKGETGTEKWKM